MRASLGSVLLPAAGALALTLSTASAASEYRGINLSAAAFGHYSDTDPAANALPGVYGMDYIYPDAATIDSFHALGMNTFRLPFRWERIQPTLGGALDTLELDRLNAVVDHVTNLGANVILDVHNYARFLTADTVMTFGAAISGNDFSNLWTRLATEFANRDGIIFDLMNEPFGVETEVVVDFTNLALQAIRDTGAGNLALVEGNGYSGGHSWSQDWYGTPNAVAMLDIVDPGNNLAFEVHQYADNNEGVDRDYSGLTDHVESATILAEKLAGFTDWLRANNRRGFLGEVGTPASPLGIAALTNGVSFVEQNADVWMGWTLWSGGPWWDHPEADPPTRYHLSLNPLPDGAPSPQLAALEPFLNPVPEPGPGMLVVLAALILGARGYGKILTGVPTGVRA